MAAARRTRTTTSSIAAALALAAVTVPLLPAGSAAAATCPAPSGPVIPKAEAPVGAEVVFTGGGLGHNVGFSQYGAQGAARLGCTAPQILTKYFAGSRISTATMPDEVKLWMLQDGTSARVLADGGPVQWQATGCADPLLCSPTQPAGSTWQVLLDPATGSVGLRDAVTNVPLWSGAPGQGLTLKHSGTPITLTTYVGTTVHLKRRLRWDSTRFTGNLAGLDVVQSIVTTSAGQAMDKYLWGLGEVPISWTNTAHEGLRAQAISARNYAYLKVKAGVTMQPTPAHQNYTGYTKELEDARYRDLLGRNYRWKDAVDSTSGQVVLASDGSILNALFSSSFGGWSDTNDYVWGSPTLPYLQMMDDSAWDLASDNPNRAWARGFTLADVASRLGFTSVSTISVAPRGTVARNNGVVVTGVRNGVKATVTFTGWDVRMRLGLPSPGFTAAISTVGGLAARPLTGDWNGDGRTDLGWYKNGRVAMRMPDGTIARFRFGKAGDRPVVGDWDGNGTDTIGVYRAGSWHLRNANTAGKAHKVVRYAAPAAGAVPVVGDWNGDGRDGLGFVRKATWHVRDSLTSGRTSKKLRYGTPGDRYVVGDWDGNGTDTPGVWRSGTWYLRNSVTTGRHDVRLVYGTPGDRPVVGDWNGDGRFSPGLVRGTTWQGTDGWRALTLTALPGLRTTFRG